MFASVVLLLCALSPWLGEAKLVQKTLNLTWETGAPNGASRELILTNGQYPGPELIFDEDDDVEVTVNNRMPFNTTVHWHGLSQHGSPWSDGTPGLSQVPIMPNSSFIYRFKASPAGTYWYHAHFRARFQDGQLGGIHIRRKPDARRPYSLMTDNDTQLEQLIAAENHSNLLVLTDWTQLTSTEYWQVQVDSGYDLSCVDSLLINGKGSVYCPGADVLQDLGGGTRGSVLEGTRLTDKGCLEPRLRNLQSIYLDRGRPDAIPDNMYHDCTPSDGGMFVVEVDPDDGWASLGFIGSQAIKALIVSVDDHPMWVYEIDGSYVEPQRVEAIQIFNGVRYSVMIKLDQTPGNYSIRVSSNWNDQIISGFATLSYRGASEHSPSQSIGPYSKGYIDYNGVNTTADVRILSAHENLPPFDVPPPPPPEAADRIHILHLSRAGGAYLWSLDGHELFLPEEWSDTPALQNPDVALSSNGDVALHSLNDTWVDIVIQVVAGDDAPFQRPHPIHKHGNRAYVLGFSPGFFNWSSIAEAYQERPELFNFANPPFRDTFTTSPLTPRVPALWAAIRYHVDTPGAFMLHCHTATHQESGMGLAMLDGVDAWPDIPPEYETGAQGFPPGD